jgi:hypothetical protein
MEGMVVSGWPVLYGGMPIYGLTTAPYRNIGALGAQWTNPATTGAEILADVQAMIAALQGDLFYGPYVLYVPLTYYNRLNEDYKDLSDLTILQRLLQLPQLSDIKPTEFLPNHNVILAQMTQDVVDIVDGFPPTVIQWDEHAGMVFHFKVMSIMVPRFKWDALQRSGIAHYSI